MSTQILLIRHGETDWNRIKRLQVHIDIPLATSGLAQAERLARRLALEVQAGERLDAIYSSDLQRAQQTAQPVADALGLPLNLREGLRERSYGVFEGNDRDEIAERYPDEFAHWQTRDEAFAPPKGESQRAFYHRVLQTLEPIVAAHPNGRIACVAHGGVLDCVYRYVNGLPLDTPRNYALLNASINVVKFEAGVSTVLSWADIAHLDAPAQDDDLKVIPEAGR